MNDTLKRWNSLSKGQAFDEILPCCGSRAWATGMVERRPMPDKATLLAISDEIWAGLGEADWMEAFRCHPRIGESRSRGASVQALAWSAQEQRRVADDGEAVKLALAKANREYERRFGYIFIVCATGRSSGDILEILRRRLHNDSASELSEAAGEQRQITQIRLQKWMGE